MHRRYAANTRLGHLKLQDYGYGSLTCFKRLRSEIHSIPLITRPLGPAKTHVLSVPPPIRSNLLWENQFCHQILPPLKQYRALSGRVISGIECTVQEYLVTRCNMDLVWWISYDDKCTYLIHIFQCERALVEGVRTGEAVRVRIRSTQTSSESSYGTSTKPSFCFTLSSPDLSQRSKLLPLVEWYINSVTVLMRIRVGLHKFPAD